MRLQALRHLVAAEPDGLTAGEIAAALDARPNTLSTNLGVLSQANLVRSQREGRQILFRPARHDPGAYRFPHR